MNVGEENSEIDYHESKKLVRLCRKVVKSVTGLQWMSCHQKKLETKIPSNLCYWENIRYHLCMPSIMKKSISQWGIQQQFKTVLPNQKLKENL